MNKIVRFSFCVTAAWAVTPVNAQIVERPAGQVEIVHATGLLRLDAPPRLSEIVLGGQPFAIASIDLDGDGMGDRNHDLVVATQNGIFVLEARPLAGDLSIRGINAFLATNAPSAPTGGRIAAFDTRPIGTPPVDVAPDVLALYTGIPEVRFLNEPTASCRCPPPSAPTPAKP